MGLRRVSAKRSPFPSELIGGADFDIGTVDTNAITVSIQMLDQGMNPSPVPVQFDWYISDQATGIGYKSAALTGNVAAGTNGKILVRTAGKNGHAVTEDDGTIDFVLTDSGNPTVYLVICLPDGGLLVSDAIDFTEPGTGA